MSRKESIKKALGISEYPWSSDDDEPETSPMASGLHSRRQQNHVDSPMPADSPGPSGVSNGNSNSSSRRRNQLFWSLEVTSPQRSIQRRVELPGLSLISRQYNDKRASEHSSRTSPTMTPASLHRILALRRLNRNLANCRPRASSSGAGGGSGGGGGGGPRAGQPTPLPAEVTAILEAGMRRAIRRRHRHDYGPTLNAAVMGGGLTAARGGPGRSPPRAPPPPPLDEPVDLDESDDDVELTEPPLRNEMSIEASATAGSEGALGEQEERNTSAENEYEMLQQGEDNVENDEPVPSTSVAVYPDNSQPQPKKDIIKRRRDTDEESSGPASVKEFNQSLLRLLECPVCLEWLEPPMSQCRRGHLVCSRCRARLAACPVCRTAFSSVRNRAMEGVAEMVRYPCRHSCGREVRLKTRATHEASCAARRYRCPAPACAHRAALPHRDLQHHLQSKHPTMVRMGWKQQISTKLNEERHENWVIMAMHQMFHLRIDIDIRNWGLVIYVAYIGPKCNASQYTYKVTIEGEHSRCMTYTRATHCDLECSSLNVGRQDCFHLTLEQGINFLRETAAHGELDRCLVIDIELSTANGAETNVEEVS